MGDSVNSIAGRTHDEIYANYKEAVAKLGTTDIAVTIVRPSDPDVQFVWSTRAKLQADIAKLEKQDEPLLDTKYQEPRKDTGEVMFCVTDGANVIGDRVALATVAPV